MLQVMAAHKLEGIEPALRRAAQHHGASIVSVTHLGHLLRDRQLSTPQDAIVFSLCQPDLSTALLGADIRFAAFLPCRIAAYEQGGAVVLEALSPSEFSRTLNRPDLDRLVLLMETTLREIMDEASRPMAAPTHAPVPGERAGVGATEDQVNVRGSIPQRIDCRGTKVEEIAGTGRHDSPGG